MAEILQNIQMGFGVVLIPINLFYCFLGCLVGTLVGVLPGIGPLAALSLLLPITFKMDPTASIIMLAGIFYGAMYGGSTTSILVNIPGEAASVVTSLDGYQLAKQGKAGAALGIAAIGSFIAGTLSTVGVSLFSPVLVTVALKFGPPEYLAVMTLGFVLAMFMVGGSALKALLLIMLGLFVSTIGMDVISGDGRFTFGVINLASGFELVAVIMGMFGISEVLINMEWIVKQENLNGKINGILPSVRDFTASWIPILRGSFVGFVFGVLPGAGPVSASFVSYAVEKRFSRKPERFGRGAIEGVAGPEAANNSAVAGSMIPMLSLGVPCNAVMAIMLGALVIHGVQPGPTLMTKHPEIFWGVIASMYVGNVMLLVLNLPLIGIWVQFLRIPYRILFTLILLLCIVGTYSTNLNMFDVWVMIGFGVLGYLLRKLNYELAPFILALVLGPLFEVSLRQSMILSHMKPMFFFNRPITMSLLVLSSILAVMFVIGKAKRRRKVGASLQTQEE
jgi:putative tricarboxylic transport membrane protein